MGLPEVYTYRLTTTFQISPDTGLHSGSAPPSAEEAMEGTLAMQCSSADHVEEHSCADPSGDVHPFLAAPLVPEHFQPHRPGGCCLGTSTTSATNTTYILMMVTYFRGYKPFRQKQTKKDFSQHLIL